MDVQTARRQIIIDHLVIQMHFAVDEHIRTLQAAITRTMREPPRFQRVPPSVGPFKGGC